MARSRTATGESLYYLFILAFVLIVVAYFGGFTKVLSTAGSVLANLGNIYSGRTPQGNFPNYPAGGPTS